MDSGSDSEPYSDEEFGGSSGSEPDEQPERHAAAPAAKRHKASHEALHGAGDGIDHAEDAEVSLMALEVRELLEEAAASEDVASALREAATRAAAVLRAAPEATVDPSPIAGLLADFQFPTNRRFTFHPPDAVEVVGSYALGGAALADTPLDLTIVMPAACFDDKDQLNHRYHAKRALYLAHAVATVSAALDVDFIEWEPFRGDPRRPVAVLRLGEGAGAIRLLPAAPSTLFPLARLAPTRNNLRSAAKPPKKGSKDAEPELLPTPYYNSGILQDMGLLGVSQAVAAAADSAPHLAEASVLLRIWADRQRLTEGNDGVDGFFLTALLAHLIEAGKASRAMGAMHLFRATLMALANPKTFSGTGLTSKNASNASATPPPPVKAWRAAGHDVIFLDSSGWVNLGAHVSAGALAQAAACAKATAALLSASAGPDAFDAAFLARHSLAPLADAWYKIEVPGEAEPAGALARDLPPWVQTDRKVAEVAAKALGARATLVRVLRRGAAAVPAGKRLRAKSGKVFAPERSYALLAARLDPTAALRGVDIGPSADSGAPAAAFRAFWGEKSELRRFQDGKICEAVVWDVPPSQRHLIVDAIVAHALGRHLPGGAAVTGTSGLVDAALRRKKGATPDADIVAARLCDAAATRLGKRLRSLDGLTLKIVGTQPLAPVLRSTAAFPPLPHMLAGAAREDLRVNGEQSSVPRCLPAVEILCQLEGSGRWPDGPAAFAKMKAALGVQLAQKLEESFGIDASASEDYIDVLTDGFAFRLVLHTERDAAMQSMALIAAGMPHPPPEEDVSLRVWHHGAVAAAAAANPAFGPAVRLAKRWVASQWLSPHFRDEAVELLATVAFAAGGGSSVAAPPPGAPLAGLLRILELLGNHPWAAAPLMADLAGGDPGPTRRAAAARAHAAQRAAETAPAMFITGPKDDECVGWTREHPTRPMLHRAAVLARRAAGALGAALTAGADPEAALAAAFAHDDAEYEVVIRLRSDALPDRDVALSLGKKKGSSRAGWAVVEPPADDPDAAKRSRAVLKGVPLAVLQARGAAAVRKELLVGFHPVPLFVSLLEERFGAVAIPCADYLGGVAVGLKLRGPALKPGPLRPEAAHAALPLIAGRGEELVVGPDLAAIAADALALGAGLVERVEFKESIVSKTQAAQNPLFVK